MADPTTRPPHATRAIETTRGLLTYAELARLFLPWLLRRLELPPVDLVPTDAAGTAAYLGALRAADRSDWQPLAAIWEQRLAAPLD